MGTTRLNGARAALSVGAAIATIALYAGPVGASGGPLWQSVLSSSGPSSLTDVSCLGSTSTCVAIGYGLSDISAAVFRSTDSGVTWQPVSIPPGIGPVTNLVCPTETNCYATGENQSTLTAFTLDSTDGGVTWSYSQSIAMSGVSALSCPSALVCFATGIHFGLVFDSTTDGGATWSETGIPIPSNGNEFSFGGLSCPTTTTCYFAEWEQHFPTNGGIATTKLHLKRTLNAGATFTSLPLPSTSITNYGGSLSCPSALTCYANDGSLTGSFLDETTNGGATWTHGSSMAPYFTNGWFTCISVTTCVALATSSARFRYLYSITTTDSGSTWTPSPIGPATGSGFFGNLVCSASTVCIADGAGLPDGVVATESAGGWSSSSVPRGSSALTSVACSSAAHCVAVGTGDAFVSNDGGATWSAATAAPGVAQGSTSVGCASDTVCLAVGGQLDPRNGDLTGSASISRDGGDTWTAQKAPARSNQLDYVTCPSVSLCFALSATNLFTSRTLAPQLFRTTDLGATWQQIAMPLTPRLLGALTGLTCPSARVCYAIGVGLGGRIDGSFALKSTNAGLTWRRLNLAAAASNVYESLVCSSVTRCLTVGQPLINVGLSSPSGLYTTNGGLTFKPFRVPSALSRVAQIVVSGATMKVLGSITDAAGLTRAAVFTSTNAGRSWLEDSLPASNGLSGLTAAGSGFVAVGASALNGPLIIRGG